MKNTNDIYSKLLYERDILISHILDIDISLKRIELNTCSSCFNVEREINDIYGILNEILREKNQEIDRLFIANHS